MLDNMYTIDDIKSMSGTNDQALVEALFNGLDTVTTGKPLEEGLFGKIMTIGALLAGTIFSGCAGNSPRPDAAERTISLPDTASVNAENVNKLALDIAQGINDEMETASSVVTTQSWQAAKDIYSKLVKDNRKELADMFARTINRKKNEFFNAPPCCDDKTYNNSEKQQQDHTPVYNEEAGMMEYN